MTDQTTAVARMRRNYTQSGLDEDDLAADPITQFRQWFDAEVEANEAAPYEPNAMILATVCAQGNPRTRTVLLKAIDDDGLVFFTQTHSAKARDIAANPHVALTFCWPNLERQVNVAGKAEPVSRQRASAYFRQRPRDNQLGAAVSRQSQVVPSRQALEDELHWLTERLGENAPVPVPDSWGGYKVRPTSIEFWQGRVGRLHDRLRYRWADKGWVVERLSP